MFLSYVFEINLISKINIKIKIRVKIRVNIRAEIRAEIRARNLELDQVSKLILYFRKSLVI